MAQHLNPSPITDPNRFGERVYISARELAQARFERGTDNGAHDMAMLVFLQFWADPKRWMASYTPEVFAAVALRNRAEDWRRSERIQRGQGAHMVERDGARVARREIGSLDVILEAFGDPTTDGHDVAEAATTSADVRDALALLSRLQRKVVWKVDVEGYTVVEVAKTLGFSRTYCQRELGKARQFIRDYVVAA